MRKRVLGVSSPEIHKESVKRQTNTYHVVDDTYKKGTAGALRNIFTTKKIIL